MVVRPIYLWEARTLMRFHRPCTPVGVATTIQCPHPVWGIACHVADMIRGVCACEGSPTNASPGLSLLAQSLLVCSAPTQIGEMPVIVADVSNA